MLQVLELRQCSLQLKQIEQMATAFSEHAALQRLDVSAQGPAVDGAAVPSKDESEALSKLGALVV